VGCASGVQPLIAAGLLEEMTAPLGDDGDGGLAFPGPEPYERLLAGKSALVVGPGIGVSPERRTLVEWLATGVALPVVLDHLDALSTLDLVALDREAEQIWMFKHAVTRDVAYESLPFALRSLLHGKVGEYLERTEADRRPVRLLGVGAHGLAQEP